MKFPRAAASLLSILSLVILIAGCSQPKKQAVTKLDDLPRHTYALTGKASDVITDPAAYAALAAKVQADTESDLAHYDIEDKTTLKRLKGVLLHLSLLRGDDATSLRLIGELRQLATNPTDPYLTGLISECRIAAARAAGNSDSDAFRQEFQKELTQRIAALPWAVVQADLKELKGTFETSSANLLLGVVQSQIEPAVAKTGVLSYDVAEQLIAMKNFIDLSLPLKTEVIAVISQAVAAHQVVKPDIWAARALVFPPGQKLTPVQLGVWDSGVDLALFPGRVALDAKGQPAVIAYDLDSNLTMGDLYPIPDKGQLPAMESQIKGELDIDAAVDSPEAEAVQKKMASLSQDEVKPYLEQIEMFSNYAHGTHVAGIATAGNPQARIVLGRITFDYRMIPEVPTIEQSKKDAASYQATVDFFKQNGTRVVNMSWGGSLKDVEGALEANGVGKDATERAKMARAIFQVDRDGLYAALKSAPDILFVTAAGNSDNDVAFDEVTPSSFELPNLLVVGAVDQAGDQTSFTSFGKNVKVYADGFEVESVIPGGDKLKFSGTSMASPNVENLAAKLLVVDPALTPTELISLIEQGADAGDDPRLKLINPEKSLQLLQAQGAAK